MKVWVSPDLHNSCLPNRSHTTQ